MSVPFLKVKLNYSDAKIPTKAYPTDSGFDLYVYSITKCSNDSGYIESVNNLDEMDLYPNQRALVPTGISATVEPGYEIQIRPKSGLAIKDGITVLNTPGTVDESYIGEICVIIINNSNAIKTIKKGDKIAQLVVCPVTLSEIKIVDNFYNTQRGSGGFGSTGV